MQIVDGKKKKSADTKEIHRFDGILFPYCKASSLFTF